MKKKHIPFKTKIDRLRLEAFWGRGKRMLPKPKPVGIKKGTVQVIMAGNVHNIWANDLLQSFMPKRPEGKIFDYAHTFENALERRGFKRLGSGCFSTVYAKDGSKRVVKVTRKIDNWIDYIHWASENGYAGRFAPKVYSYKKFKGKEEPFSVAVVERCKPINNCSAKDDGYIIGALLWPCMRGNTMAQLYLDDMQPGLGKFLLDFNEKFGKDHTDIGGNNMLFREDGSWCLTDPLCGQSKMTVNRLRTKDFLSLAPAIKELYESLYHYTSRRHSMGCSSIS